MTNFEIAYLITENSIVAGQAFMDVVTIVFAIMVTGYVAGPKLSKGLIWAMVVVSATFMIPIITMVYRLIGRTIALGDALPADQFDALPYLAHFANQGGNFPEGIAQTMFVLSLTAAYAGAVYFVFYCRKKRIGQMIE